MPKASSSNPIVGFLWWFHTWGHSVVDPLFSRLSKVSIWSDLEDMVVDLPWKFGMAFWLAPLLFFTGLTFLSLYAFVVAGAWGIGLLLWMAGKFLGSGWFRYGQRVMHPALEGMPWYDTRLKKWARSKQQGLKAYRATGLSKSFSKVYTRISGTMAQKIGGARERVEQFKKDRE